MTLRLDKFSPSQEQLKILDIAIKFFIITCAILFLSCSFLFFRKAGNIVLPAGKKIVSSFGEKTYAKKKDLSYYHEIFNRRAIFTAQLKTGKDQYRQIELGPGNTDLDVSQLQLTGVVQGKQGLQAVISNTKTEQTYFCPVGEKIGNFTIKKVLQNKVILDIGGKDIELTL